MSSSSVSGGLRPSSDRLPQSFNFRILAIDGGGIRGIIPATFLAALEGLLDEALARRRAAPAGAPEWAGIDQPRIADCFHLIAGTSTGGLLAAGLTTTDANGRPKLPASDAADVYVVYGAEIFHRPLLRNVFDHFGLLAPKYPLEQLRQVLERDSGLGDGLLKDARTEVLIVAFDTAVPGPRFFTRWGAPGAEGTPSDPSETIVQVALATAAAPTYFEPEVISRAPMIDGGVYAGNPALAAITMALRRTVAPVPRTAADLFMVSLGTGAWSEPLDFGGGGILGWLWPRAGGEALIEAMLGGSSDFANEAAHLLLNGYAETTPPAKRTRSRLRERLVGAEPAADEHRRGPAAVALSAAASRPLGARRRQQAAGAEADRGRTRADLRGGARAARRDAHRRRTRPDLTRRSAPPRSGREARLRFASSRRPRRRLGAVLDARERHRLARP